MLSFAFTLTFVLIVVQPDRGAAKPTMVDICAGCSMKNGVGYMRHTDCNKFVHCYEDGDSKVIGVVQECGSRMAWDQDLLTCVASSTCAASSGICASARDGATYPDPVNCRSYWNCWNGYPTKQCCPDGQYYKLNTGCTLDSYNKCDEWCSMYQLPTTKITCNNIRPVPGSAGEYEQYISGWDWVRRLCPVGLQYVQEDCGCTKFSVLELDTSCRPEVHLLFNGSYDQSGTYVRYENVDIRGGRGVFNGDNSQLIIPRFTNVETDSIIIKVKYTSNHRDLSRPHSIISNSDCGLTPSILITEDSQRINFHVGTVTRSMNFETVVSVNQTSSNDKEIVFRFNKGVLAGRLGSDSSVKFGIPGFIRGTHCALHVGKADVANGDWFKGEMEELSIYMCDI
ncbi:protein PIF-like [Dreissena polymorpha]|uniref:Chitin-binding type-2 domain-containing protein n=1 Tax=Dreissena polymorpha TaxID=45954 RepID=A0A9D4RU03_DREPO|nr:protein PIF-like [Dreissena polymorpha]KAH3881039.1 hypothetical protein DPMN_004963 [Dreissena polymorpha]